MSVNLGVFNEGGDLRFTAVLKDKAGVFIPFTSLSLLTLTVYAAIPGEPIVNGIDHVGILNVGRGTVDSFGNHTVTLSGANGDMNIVGPRSTASDFEEQHIMLFEWLTTGGESGNDDPYFFVQPVIRR